VPPDADGSEDRTGTGVDLGVPVGLQQVHRSDDIS
jgi:hypothetical protein